MKISLDWLKEYLDGDFSLQTAVEALERIGLMVEGREDVQILNEDLCPRYCGVVVKGIKVGPSPAWLQKRIRSMGLNPINNVVDVSNYVLFSTSQPIHAFDLAKIARARGLIRRAQKGESLP